MSVSRFISPLSRHVAAWAWVLSLGQLHAQPAWVPAGLPFRFLQMREIYADSSTDRLYFCGSSSINNDFVFDDAGIAVLVDQTWDTLGPINGEPESVIRWGDTLVVGGYVPMVGGQSFNGCLGFVNGEAVPFGNFGLSSPKRFRILDGELYAVGGFTVVDGHEAPGVARRVGGTWVPVGSTNGMLPGGLNSDIIKYNGQLILAGGLAFDWTLAHGIAVLNDTTWSPLGPGLNGNFTYAGALAIYHDELYLGGGIHISEGNIGEGILKWTGTDFEAVGTGLQNQFNQPAINVGASYMKVYNDLLYVSGVFWFAGNVPAMGMATWDGLNWCGLGGTLEMPILTFDFFHDTLYVAPLFDADGQPANGAAKYIGNYPATCTPSGLGVAPDNADPADLPSVLVLPSELMVQAPLSCSACEIRLLDMTGRTLAHSHGSPAHFSTSDLGTGVYFVAVAGHRSVKVLIE